MKTTIQNFILALALFACFGCVAQERAAAPATQAEVDAGLTTKKFVSPLTLANWSGRGSGSGGAISATNIIESGITTVTGEWITNNSGSNMLVNLDCFVAQGASTNSTQVGRLIVTLDQDNDGTDENSWTVDSSGLPPSGSTHEYITFAVAPGGAYRCFDTSQGSGVALVNSSGTQRVYSQAGAQTVPLKLAMAGLVVSNSTSGEFVTITNGVVTFTNAASGSVASISRLGGLSLIRGSFDGQILTIDRNGAEPTVVLNYSGAAVGQVRGVQGGGVRLTDGSAGTQYLLANANGISIVGNVVTNGNVVWLSTNATPSTPLPNGSIATVSDGRFFVRTNSQWVERFNQSALSSITPNGLDTGSFTNGVWGRVPWFTNGLGQAVYVVVSTNSP